MGGRLVYCVWLNLLHYFIDYLQNSSIKTTTKIRSSSLRKAPLWPTAINPHQPPCFEHLGSAVATLLSTATSPTSSPN